MKVLLVHRGEPFPFPRMGSSSLVPPFIFVQLAWDGREGCSLRLPRGYSVYVLPCPLFHGVARGARPGLCLVYGEPEDALSCIEGGAVDFLREGWNLHELGARLYRLWRPEIRSEQGRLTLHGESLCLSPEGEGERAVDLTPQGAALLRVLLARGGRPTPASILKDSSGSEENGEAALPMRISRLRARLALLDPELATRLRSCGGGGYSLGLEEGEGG